MSTVSEGTFAGQGDVPIYWRRAAPAESPPRGVILIAHGYAEHLGRYRDFVEHLTARGLAAVALDHRGHGRSGGPRGHCSSFTQLTSDLFTLTTMAGEWWPHAPRVLFGHSMGGLLALLYLLRHPEAVCAAALSAPALRVPDATPRILQAIALLLGRVAPRLAFKSRLDAPALARDPAVGAAYVADPLVHRRATAGFFRALRAAQVIVLAEADRIRTPLLLLQGDADRIVDPSGAADIAARLRCAHEYVVLPGFYHELLNEPPGERAQVLELLDRWFERWVVGGG